MNAKNNTLLLLAFGILCVPMFAGCGENRSKTPGTEQTSNKELDGLPNQSSFHSGSSTNLQEAGRLAAKCALEHWEIQENGALWWGHLTKENSLVPGTNPDVQFKSITPQIVEEKLSEADQLNGVEWHGNVNFSARTFRTREVQWSQKKWEYMETMRALGGAQQPYVHQPPGPWQDWQTFQWGMFWSVRLEKRNGKWTVTEQALKVDGGRLPHGSHITFDTPEIEKPNVNE